MRKLLLLTLCGLASTPIFAETTAKITITKINNIQSEHGQDEISGLVRSRTYDNLWWAHNDSGNGPMIFPLDANGSVVQFKKKKPSKNKYGGRHKHGGIPVELATNIDWEDIAIDDGLIYIADIGNNNNARRDLGIYVIAEPNPFYTERIRAQKYIPVRFPDQQQFPPDEWNFDSESLFISDDNLYLLTKHHQKGITQ